MNTTASKDTKSSATVPGQTGAGKRSGPATSASTLLSSRQMNLPRAMVGGLGVLACSLGAVVASHVLDPRTSVLMVTQPVAVGQVITAADVRPVPVTVGGGVDVVPAAQAGSVVGRRAALSLAAGALLGSADVGSPTFPPTGQAVAAVGLKPGMFPLHLTAGDRVQVVLPTTPGLPIAPQSAASTPSLGSLAVEPLVATVTAVGKPDSQGNVVANLLMDTDGAAKVAGASTSMSGVAVTLLPAGDS